jgi:hypothetical protein
MVTLVTQVTRRVELRWRIASVVAMPFQEAVNSGVSMARELSATNTTLCAVRGISQTTVTTIVDAPQIAGSL